MNKLITKLINFYKKETELDVVFFKLLGTAGALISLIGAVQSIFTLTDWTGFVINMGAAVGSVVLVLFVDKTGHYLIGYLITSFGILFTLLMYRTPRIRYVMLAIHIVFVLGEAAAYIFEQIATGKKSLDDMEWVKKILQDSLSSTVLDKVTAAARKLSKNADQSEIMDSVAQAFAKG